MFFEYNKKIEYYDIDISGKMSVERLAVYLQEIAINHSNVVGVGIDYLRTIGFSWYLHKYMIKIDKMPSLGDSLYINTWSRGVKGIKAFREFEFFINGEISGRATTAWLFTDIVAKKPAKIPSTLLDKYLIEERDNGFEIEKMQVENDFDVDFNISQTTRFSDLDTNGHMNNSAYVSVIETLIKKKFGLNVQIDTIFLQFKAEILFSQKNIETALSYKIDNKLLFKIYDENNIFLTGWCTIK